MKLVIVELSKNNLKRALEIAVEYDIPVYDSLFLSQAEALKAKLVTSDKGLEQVAKEIKLDWINPTSHILIWNGHNWNR